MNSNLFMRELRSNAVSLFIWTSVITALTALTMSFYGVFLENNQKILAMISIIPEGTLQFKGISDVDDLFSVLGFYSANNVIYMLVLGSIYSIVLSSGILLKEEYNKTAEFLLAWPLTRGEVFYSKAAVVFLNVAVINIVTAIAGYITLETVKREPFSTDAFIVMSVYTLLLNLFFRIAGTVHVDTGEESKTDHHTQHRAGAYPLFHLHNIKHHGWTVIHRLCNSLQVRRYGYSGSGLQARVHLCTLFWRSVIALFIHGTQIVQAQGDLFINLINK